MGKDYAPNLIPVAFQIRKVRDYQIHPQQFIIWECKSTVYNNNIVRTFIQVNILSDFSQTSQGDNPNRGFSLLARGTCWAAESGWFSFLDVDEVFLDAELPRR